MLVLNRETAGELLPIRPQNSNKGTFGKALLVLGSEKMCGCCRLAANGALRSGVGLVRLCFPDVLYSPLLSSLTECVFEPLKTSDEGSLSFLELSKVNKLLKDSDVILYGCGVGVSEDTKALTDAFITQNTVPLILDADGLNCLSKNIDILKRKTCDILLTPHPGEMARLTDLSVAEIEKNRETVIREFAKEYDVTVLLKGHETLICSPDGIMYKNVTGNSGLAKGGSGDLLAGLIAGLFVTMKGDFCKSAALGAYLHGLSGEIAAEKYSEYACLPTDCAECLGEAFLSISK